MAGKLSFLRGRITKGAVLAAILAAVSVWACYPQISAVYTTVSAAEKRKIPIYCVEPDRPKVSVSFDAAWGADDTGTLLKILDDNNVKATFFLCGYWIDKHPDEVRNIFSRGHDVGNHGNTHAHGAQLSLESNQKEIMGAHEKIKNLLGIDMNLFRPPYGEYNNTVVCAAEALN
jgi:peptidoglycan/xylan/chitin deacetylase (PgdA/CDA1 family)